MKRAMMMMLTMGLLLPGLSGRAEAKTIRATEIRSLAELLGSREEMIVEFRQGDELPVSFTTEGDLLETSRPGISYVDVKRNFWLRFQGQDVRMSLDGRAYRPIRDMVTGSFTAGANAEDGGIVNAIRLGLKAELK